jgi:hypothetical protein
LCCTSVPWGEDEIAMDHQPNCRARTDRDGGLDPEIALRDLIPGTGHAVLRRHADRLHKIVSTAEQFQASGAE